MADERQHPGAIAADAPVVIDVRELGVRYNLRLTRKNTVRQSFTNLLKRRDDGPTSFWALREVTFHLTRGESLAVIGPNGAGKSTLLQALAGIITPSAGEIAVRGQISSLLTLGAGFDADLTGRDNILLAGAFMGMSHRETQDRLESIIAFADIGEFIDKPVKTYSSGMFVRLAFAIAIHVNPEILIVDEALALDPLPKVIWMQLGVRDDTQAARAEAAGIKVVMNRCPAIEIPRLGIS